jgi:hypothetical protein
MIPDFRVSMNQSQTREQEAPPVRLGQGQPPPVKPENIQIIPGLPDRSNNNVYRLQVGAFSALETANRAAELMKAAGFEVQQEYSNSSYRVMAVGIAASDVYQASIRLGALGFGQIWVRQ